MMDAPFYSGTGPVSGTETHTLFGQTMEYVAITAGFFALGAYTGRNLSSGWAVAAYIAAFACLIAMRFTVRRSPGFSAVLLFIFGALMGLAMSPTLVYYASVNPQALWQAGGATALFMAACGGIGFATRRDLSGLARASFWALIALILFGVVLIFVNIPGGSLAYSIIGLVIFAGLTMSDFQRLRRSADIDSAPLMAASIFLDVLNVFLFFLRIFSRDNRLGMPGQGGTKAGSDLSAGQLLFHAGGARGQPERPADRRELSGRPRA
jgi:FtsH-binding integral membrane protein